MPKTKLTYDPLTFASVALAAGAGLLSPDALMAYVHAPVRKPNKKRRTGKKTR